MASSIAVHSQIQIILNIAGFDDTIQVAILEKRIKDKRVGLREIESRMLRIEWPVSKFHICWWFYILIWKLEGHLIPSIVRIIVTWTKVAYDHFKWLFGLLWDGCWVRFMKQIVQFIQRWQIDCNRNRVTLIISRNPPKLRQKIPCGHIRKEGVLFSLPDDRLTRWQFSFGWIFVKLSMGLYFTY